MSKIPADQLHLVDPETGEFSQALLDLEEAAVTSAGYLNPDGSENPDPTPIAPPIGYKRQPTLVENMRAMIREHALALALAGQDAESFEEADDFEIGDDYDPKSPWEGEFEPIAQVNAEEAAKNAKAKKPVPEAPPAPAEQPPQAAPAASPPPPKP